MIEIFSYTFTPGGLTIFLVVGFFIGMSKTGVHGAGMVAVPLLASVFGGQHSSGIMLPVLCFADVFGVWYYHRHASWRHLRKLFPWAFAGTLLGVWIGNAVSDEIFKMIMAVIIVVSVGIMVWLERGNRGDVPDYRWFAALTGVAGGFTSMVGNLAGSVMAIYFLSMRLPKNSFIGTTAWFFMVINWLKIPFHAVLWGTITWETILLDTLAIPLIILGGIAGIYIVKNLREQSYRWFIIAMTVVAAVFMFV